MGLCFLYDQEIAIGGAQPAMTIVDEAVAPGCPASASKKNLFSWVAPISKIEATWGAVDPNCLLAAGSGALHSGVIARLQLTAGTLSTANLFNSPSATYDCGFKTINGLQTSLHHQAIADVVELLLPVPTGQLTLQANPLRGTNAYKPILLNVNSNLTVYVKNLPIVDVLAHRDGEAIKLGSIRKSDQHFLHHYQLCLTPPTAAAGYVYFPIVECSGIPTVQSPKCPPASFAPHA
jgi:hypothetical protein